MYNILYNKNNQNQYTCMIKCEKIFLFHMLSLDFVVVFLCVFFLVGGGMIINLKCSMYKIKLYKIIVQLIRVDDSWNGCCIQDIEKIETLAHV